MAVAAMLLVVALAQIGLNPIVSVTLLASLLGDGVGADPRLLAVGLMCAWSLSMISSPFTASMLVLSQLIDRSPYRIAWRWNGLFFVLVVPMLALWLILVAKIL
jgi:MFS family permease